MSEKIHARTSVLGRRAKDNYWIVVEVRLSKALTSGLGSWGSAHSFGVSC